MLIANEQPFKTILIGNFEKWSHVLYMSLFCGQVFKTTSNVLNFDVNIVNRERFSMTLFRTLQQTAKMKLLLSVQQFLQ